ncbi:unnamed protein product [Pedinophyceae sp. YPF-701]|nr:unnamed protein product [Pedinophyceae sp. YPF-701]
MFSNARRPPCHDAADLCWEGVDAAFSPTPNPAPAGDDLLWTQRVPQAGPGGGVGHGSEPKSGPAPKDLALGLKQLRNLIDMYIALCEGELDKDRQIDELRRENKRLQAELEQAGQPRRKRQRTAEEGAVQARARSTQTPIDPRAAGSRGPASLVASEDRQGGNRHDVGAGRGGDGDGGGEGAPADADAWAGDGEPEAGGSGAAPEGPLRLTRILPALVEGASAPGGSDAAEETEEDAAEMEGEGGYGDAAASDFGDSGDAAGSGAGVFTPSQALAGSDGVQGSDLAADDGGVVPGSPTSMFMPTAAVGAALVQGTPGAGSEGSEAVADGGGGSSGAPGAGSESPWGSATAIDDEDLVPDGDSEGAAVAPEPLAGAAAQHGTLHNFNMDLERQREALSAAFLGIDACSENHAACIIDRVVLGLVVSAFRRSPGRQEHPGIVAAALRPVNAGALLFWDPDTADYVHKGRGRTARPCAQPCLRCIAASDCCVRKIECHHPPDRETELWRLGHLLTDADVVWELDDVEIAPSEAGTKDLAWDIIVKAVRDSSKPHVTGKDVAEVAECALGFVKEVFGTEAYEAWYQKRHGEYADAALAVQLARSRG